MKKLNSVSKLIDLLQYNPSPDNDEMYPKFIRMPILEKIDSDDNAENIIRNAFIHLSCAPDSICTPAYYIIASFIFDDNDFKPAEQYSPLSEDVAADVYSYFFKNGVFAGKIAALRIDVFKADLYEKDMFDEKHYLGTTIFYNS